MKLPPSCKPTLRARSKVVTISCRSPKDAAALARLLHGEAAAPSEEKSPARSPRGKGARSAQKAPKERSVRRSRRSLSENMDGEERLTRGGRERPTGPAPVHPPIPPHVGRSAFDITEGAPQRLPSMDAATARQTWGSWDGPPKPRWDDPVRGPDKHPLETPFPSVEFVGDLVIGLRKDVPSGLTLRNVNDRAEAAGRLLEKAGKIKPLRDGAFYLTAQGEKSDRALRSSMGQSRVKALYAELASLFAQAR